MITEDYKKVLTAIHAKTKFGKRRKLPAMLEEYIAEKNPSSILDFGCGKGNLVNTLKEKYPNKVIFGFDPANPEYDKPLHNVEMIVSTDVLEHIEPHFLADTLLEIKANSKYMFHLISCAPAKLILPDGRNAHLIQESPVWWKEQFTKIGYTVTNEQYTELSKFSKQLNKRLPVKNYYIMAEQ